MRGRQAVRHTRVVGRLVCLLGATLAATALVPLAAGSTGASLRIAARDPLTIAGRGFRPHERVRVVVAVQVTLAKTVRASSASAFGVRFGTLRMPHCGGVFATAHGRAGTVARLKIPLPACQPASAP